MSRARFLTSKVCLVSLFGLFSNNWLAAEVAEQDLVFPDHAIAWLGLVGSHVDITIVAERIEYRDVVFEQVQIPILSGGDELRSHSAYATVGGGHLELNWSVNTAGAQPRWEWSASAQQVRLGQLPWFREVLNAGATDAQMNVRGEGGSVREIVASLDGVVSAQVGRATLRNNLLDQAGSDALAHVFSFVNPFSSSDAETILECAQLRFAITVGLAHAEQLALQTRKALIVGMGEIDLGTEEIHLDMVPEVRSGFKLGAGTAVEVVEIRGQLASPTLDPMTASLLKEGASLGAALATGGLSKLFQYARGSRSPTMDLCNGP